jgi:hypothetical protein
LANFYRKFVPHFSQIAAPLFRLLQQSQAWIWETAQQDSFDALKTALTTAPVLRRPDFGKRFVLTTDGSKLGVAGVLSQDSHPIAYFSRATTAGEKKYDARELELLAVVSAIEAFRPYLIGETFLLETDHSNLLWLLSGGFYGRLGRWTLRLSEYSFVVKHRRGLQNQAADALSRHPPTPERDLPVDALSRHPPTPERDLPVRLQTYC